MREKATVRSSERKPEIGASAKELSAGRSRSVRRSSMVLLIIAGILLLAAAVSAGMRGIRFGSYFIVTPYEAGKSGLPKDVLHDAEPPVDVDWEEMAGVNQDIIGWLYMEALPQISYPILQGEDNDFYLHHNYRGESEYAGSIFMDSINGSDFADPNTLLFGHNMRNGSMFGSLKFLKEEGRIERSPYFWVLTPQGDYCYQIFSMFYTDVDSDVYLLYAVNDEGFYEWEQMMRASSAYENEVPLFAKDKVVYLSTCTSDSSKRFVVFGKCVSSEKPKRRYDIYTGKDYGDYSPIYAEEGIEMDSDVPEEKEEDFATQTEGNSAGYESPEENAASADDEELRVSGESDAGLSMEELPPGID